MFKKLRFSSVTVFLLGVLLIIWTFCLADVETGSCTPLLIGILSSLIAADACMLILLLRKSIAWRIAALLVMLPSIFMAALVVNDLFRQFSR